MHRYVGRSRNAGFGYPLRLRLRRQVAFWLRDRGLVVLGWLVDFDRDRYAREYAREGEELQSKEKR